MPAREAPQPPYVLLFEEAASGADPLAISVDDRPALPLFGSNEKAEAFLASTDFGPGYKPVEVSGAGLLPCSKAAGVGSSTSPSTRRPPQRAA
jgi:hypothetical protein